MSAIVTARRRIKARVAQTEHAIDGAYHHALSQAHPAVNHFAQEMHDAGDVALILWLHQSGHLAKLQSVTRNTIHTFSQHTQSIIATSQDDAVKQGNDAAKATIAAVLAGWAFKHGTQAALAKIEHALLVGSRTNILLTKLSGNVLNRITKLLYAGISPYLAPTQIAERITQILDMARNQTLTIARTETFNAYRAATLAAFQANSDVVDSWTWVAGPGCCAFCAGMDGTVHSLDEEMDTHPNCGCLQQPNIKSQMDTSDIEED